MGRALRAGTGLCSLRLTVFNNRLLFVGLYWVFSRLCYNIKKDMRTFVTWSIINGLLLNNIISITPELPQMYFFVSYRSNY